MGSSLVSTTSGVNSAACARSPARAARACVLRGGAQRSPIYVCVHYTIHYITIPTVIPHVSTTVPRATLHTPVSTCGH